MKTFELTWIPCTESLPDTGRDVIITVSNGKRYDVVEACYMKNRADWVSTYSGDSIKVLYPSMTVTAWCECPQPYKE